MAIKINLGVKVHDFHNGGKTANIPVEYFKYNILISGSTQMERSASLSHILNQLYRGVPDIGVLLIKLKSNEDTYLYHLDKVFKYGDPDLFIPYFLGHDFNERNREYFARYINAIFGFHFEMRYVIDLLSRKYKGGRVPSSIIDFLEDLIKYLKENPYSEEFTESNVRSMEKAIEIFQKNPLLERILWIPLTIPEWLRLWGEGKKVCIDLSQCSRYHQRILVTLIVQAIKNKIPFSNSDTLTGIVVMEEADNLLEKPPHDEYRRNYSMNRDYCREIEEENYFLTKEQIEEAFGDKNYLFNVQFEDIFQDFIYNVFPLRNISLITVCEDPSMVYDHIRCHSQIKISLD